jgi:parallel beta-helix repeat protein
MYKKLLSLWAVFLLLTIIPIVSSDEYDKGTTIYVDDDGNADFSNIQDAIDNASDGDTIYVYEGVYYESVFINKSLELKGENKENTIIHTINKSNGVSISKNHTSISNFTIRNSTYYKSYCVYLGIGNWKNIKLKNIKIFNNIIEGNHCIDLGSVTGFSSDEDIEIYDNIIRANGTGITDYHGFRNTNLNVHDNYIEGINGGWGIALLDIRNCTFKNNIIKGFNYGFLIEVCFYNNFENNELINNSQGIQIHISGLNTFKNNNFINNSKHAFFQGGFFVPFIDDFFITPNNNKWVGNYWDDLGVKNIKVIFGRIVIPLFYVGPPIIIPLFDFDWNPAKEPYDIPIIRVIS